MSEEKLLRLKKKVDQLKIDKGVKEEKKQSLMEDLSEYDISSEESAKKRVEELDKKTEDLKKKRNNLVTKIETKLDEYESD